MYNTDILDDFDFGEDDREQHFEPGDDGVVVGKFYSQFEANVSAARLRSEGVPCFITNAISQGMMPDTQSFVSLRVRHEDIDRAREILAESAAEEAPAPTAVSAFVLENTLLIFLVVLLVFLALSAYLHG